MKDRATIEQNLQQKIGIYLTGVYDLRLKEHIRMLDWTLIDGNMRDIEKIIKERAK